MPLFKTANTSDDSDLLLDVADQTLFGQHHLHKNRRGTPYPRVEQKQQQQQPPMIIRGSSDKDRCDLSVLTSLDFALDVDTHSQSTIPQASYSEHFVTDPFAFHEEQSEEVAKLEKKISEVQSTLDDVLEENKTLRCNFEQLQFMCNDLLDDNNRLSRARHRNAELEDLPDKQSEIETKLSGQIQHESGLTLMISNQDKNGDNDSYSDIAVVPIDDALIDKSSNDHSQQRQRQQNRSDHGDDHSEHDDDQPKIHHPAHSTLRRKSYNDMTEDQLEELDLNFCSNRQPLIQHEAALIEEEEQKNKSHDGKKQWYRRQSGKDFPKEPLYTPNSPDMPPQVQSNSDRKEETQGSLEQQEKEGKGNIGQQRQQKENGQTSTDRSSSRRTDTINFSERQLQNDGNNHGRECNDDRSNDGSAKKKDTWRSSLGKVLKWSDARDNVDNIINDDACCNDEKKAPTTSNCSSVTNDEKETVNHDEAFKKEQQHESRDADSSFDSPEYMTQIHAKKKDTWRLSLGKVLKWSDARDNVDNIINDDACCNDEKKASTTGNCSSVTNDEKETVYYDEAFKKEQQHESRDADSSFDSPAYMTQIQNRYFNEPEISGQDSVASISCELSLDSIKQQRSAQKIQQARIYQEHSHGYL